MDGKVPNTANVVRSKGKKGLIIEVLIVIFVLVFVFGALNYFNILKLSGIFPNYLGSLPKRGVPTGTSQQSQQLKISCPSVKEFCEKGEGIFKDRAYVGIGYKLSSGSAIFAAFDGNLTATSSASPENFKILYLDNTDPMLRAIYFFRGPRAKIKIGQVFKGQQIAEASGKTIAIYGNSSLIFSLIPGYPGSNTPTILNKQDFE